MGCLCVSYVASSATVTQILQQPPKDRSGIFQAAARLLAVFGPVCYRLRWLRLIAAQRVIQQSLESVATLAPTWRTRHVPSEQIRELGGRQMTRMARLSATAWLVLCAVLPSGAQGRQSSDQLASRRPQTPEQKVRASHFAKPSVEALAPGITRHDNLEDGWIPVGPPPSYTKYINDLVCGSDVVVVGTARLEGAVLANGDTNIFTEYSVSGEEFLRGAPVYRQLAASTTLLVALRGGVIRLPSGDIEVKDQTPLDPQQRYVLFLERIPGTRSFTLSNPQFVVNGAKPGVRTKGDVPTEFADGSKDTAALIEDLRAASRRCGAGGGK